MAVQLNGLVMGCVCGETFLRKRSGNAQETLRKRSGNAQERSRNAQETLRNAQETLRKRSRIDHDVSHEEILHEEILQEEILQEEILQFVQWNSCSDPVVVLTAGWP